jgi:repressor of nif and glnA expression
MSEKYKKKELAILDILRAAEGPMSGARLAEALTDRGHDVSERSVRLYLGDLDRRGLTRNEGKRGRTITSVGCTELEAARTLERVGFLSSKIDEMTYGMDFDLARRSGTVVVNVTVVEPRALKACLGPVCQVFLKGFAMGQLVCLIGPGEQVGRTSIPEGKVGFCTVCSITLNGVLLKHGVPMRSRFGGLIELVDGKATRFVEMITYDGTSVDPLEIFIRSKMTNYLGAVETGNGRIGASFREIPAASRDLVASLAQQVDRIGLGAFMRIGYDGQALLGVPVNEGRAGAIVIGGLNPASIFEERGHTIAARALAGFLEFNRLYPYRELAGEINAFL